MRELADLLGQVLLQRNDGEGMMGAEYVDTIQKYSPGRAAQIRARYRRSTSSANNSYDAVANAQRAASRRSSRRLPRAVAQVS